MSDTFAVRVESEEMRPRFLKGDLAIVDPDVPVRHGDCGVFKINGVMFLRRLDQGGWLHAPGADFPDLPIPSGGKGFEVLGRVVDMQPNL